MKDKQVPNWDKSAVDTHIRLDDLEREMFMLSVRMERDKIKLESMKECCGDVGTDNSGSIQLPPDSH